MFLSQCDELIPTKQPFMVDLHKKKTQFKNEIGNRA